MTIAYVGNFTQKHCTEVHIAATLKDLGNTVLEIQENGLTSDELTVKITQEANAWDLFLFTRTWGETVTLEHLTQLKNLGVPTASYHLDLYIGLQRKYLHQAQTIEEVFKKDPFWRTDFVFTPDGDPQSAEIFKANGVKHYYMKAGVYAPECYISQDATEDANDIIFVGGGDKVGSPHAYGHPEWNYRNELITWLHDNYGQKFTKFGHPQETIRNEALNKLYKDTKVVIGDSVCIGFEHENYWSDRVYETMGRGGFIIHPYIKGLDDEFTNGENIVFYNYGDFEMLKQKIDYYLVHDTEREMIRKAGHEFVKNNCTYKQRLTQMLNKVFGAAVHYDEATELTGAQLKTIDEIKLPIKINFGAGSEPDSGLGWVNVDLLALDGIQVVHNLLLFPYPFKDSSAELIKAIDLLEHLPNYTPDNKPTVIAFIEECHRILQTGGTLHIQVPHWNSPNMWIDPTHVRGFDAKSFDYFDPDTDFGKWYGYYSDKKFKVTTAEANNNITFTMVKR